MPPLLSGKRPPRRVPPRAPVFHETEAGAKERRAMNGIPLTARETRPEGTVVTAASAVFGGKRLAVIAGPCAVESEEQVVSTARLVKAAGAVLLRGGAYKPR